jgi:hypothetical protein
VIWGRCFDPDEGARLGGLELRAAVAVWNAYPYQEHRLGSRDRRFASGGSCWLLPLTRMKVSTMTGSLAWRRPLEASGGIPTGPIPGGLYRPAKISILW